MTFKGRRQVICFVAIAGSCLVGRVSATLPSRFSACRPLPFIPDHSSRVDHAVFSPGENAGVFKLLQQPGNLSGGTAGHASELFVRDRFAGHMLEVAPAAALEGQTEHVYPEASRFKRDRTKRRIFHPVAGIELKRWQLHDASSIGLITVVLEFRDPSLEIQLEHAGHPVPLFPD